MLLPEQHLAVLVMQQAHELIHKGPKGTLAQSQGLMWIHRVCLFVRTIKSTGVYCRFKKAQLKKQEMGQLPGERVPIGQPPVTPICPDMLGPVIMEGAPSKGAYLKV